MGKVRVEWLYQKEHPFRKRAIGMRRSEKSICDWHELCFGIDHAEEGVFESRDVVSADGADEDCLDVVREVFAELLHHGVVEHIALGDGQEALFVEELGVVASKFVKKNPVFLVYVELLAADHEEQH